MIPSEILELTERFDTNREAYISGKYKEAQLRLEFVDPFFKALGWDVHNEQGYAEAYKDVIVEEAIAVGDATKAPDYCFRIGGTRKFFVETKKPSVNLKDDISPAFQLRRYAWSAKLPLSILTDFEEFVIYDCRVRPVKTDKASTARTLYLPYTDYEKRWDEIVSVFSREAVLKGSFDKYAESKKLKGTAEVDDAFLKEIESWRDVLARNIALRNPGVTRRELNYAVQRTIDRIIFLRICEARGIEDYGTLMALLNGPHVYARLFELFRKADDRYNSGLFHFREEKNRPEFPDGLTPGILIDDKPLKEIIRRLYYPESPYEFAVLPADILGQVYEQFLGKVIRLTSGHRAVVEDKPEVKKAGGVYYTPTFIVDYIVENTVGKLLEGKIPAQVEKLRLLDPACGSGSFLIAAYQYLLDWHRDWYASNDPEKWGKGKTPRLYQGHGGELKLTTSERKRILLNNIYGVDIDSQAVEVTKLSLLLKVLEGESDESLAAQLKLFHERALPDLGDNIKCGNSLVGPDYLDAQQLSSIEEDERYRVNVFDWNNEFKDIMDGGGFDAVIGNPPYIGFHGFSAEKEYLKKSYLSAKGKYDYYLPFIENGIALLDERGLLGYICPTNFTKRDHGRALRSILRNQTSVVDICDFQDVQIFSGALNYTGVFILQNNPPSRDHVFHYRKRSLNDEGFEMKQTALSDDAWIFQDDATSEIVTKIESQSVSLLNEVTSGIREGIVTGQNSVFLIDKKTAEELELESPILRYCLRGKQIRRYRLEQVDEVVIYPYKIIANKTRPFTSEEMQLYPKAGSYLNSRRADLAGRVYFDESNKNWYELWCQRDMTQLECTKIVVPELSDSNNFAIADKTKFYGDTVCGITLAPDVKEKLTFFLGILNSHLMEYYYKRTTVPKASGFYIYKTMFLKELPIRRIDFSNQLDQDLHEQLTQSVDKMMSLFESLVASNTPNDKTTIQRQISATDRLIDRLVYRLYDLTDEEISIIERETS